MLKISVHTSQKRQVIDITNNINVFLKEQKSKSGVVNIFVLHTTAAISTADLDPGGTDLDYLNAFDKLVPKLQFNHPHDPSHMPDHILSTLIGTSLNIPFENGELILGTWQRVILIELDGPRTRKVVISLP